MTTTCASELINDMDVAEDGKFYGTDEGHDKLWVLDPATGAIEAFDLPKSDLPRGGLFSGMHLYGEPSAIFTRQPRFAAQAWRRRRTAGSWIHLTRCHPR